MNLKTEQEKLSNTKIDKKVLKNKKDNFKPPESCN